MGDKEEAEDGKEDARKRASVQRQELEGFWQILGHEIV